MNTHNPVHVHHLDGLIVEVTAANLKGDTSPVVDQPEGDQTGRGDELEAVEELNKVAILLETKHMDHQANVVKAHMRELVAKQLNEFDGFDR